MFRFCKGLYYFVYQSLKDWYENVEMFKLFERVYLEHFTEVKGKIKAQVIESIAKEKRYLRNNVEVTMKQFKKDYCHGKLKVSCRFKVELFFYTMTIGINFGRIYRYVINNLESYC